MSGNTLVDLSTTQALLHAFAEHTGIGATLLGADGISLVEPRRDAPVCDLIKSTGDGSRACRDCELTRLLEAARCSESIVAGSCHAGLPTFTVIVSGDGEPARGILLSQFFAQAPDSRLYSTFFGVGNRFGISSDRMADAVARMPVIPLDTAKNYAALVERIAHGFRTASEREALVYRIGEAILNSPSLEKSLTQVVNSAVAILGQKVNLGVFVLEPLTRKLRLRAGHGMGPGDQHVADAIKNGFCADIGQGLVGLVAKEKKSEYVPNVESCRQYRQIRAATKSEFDVPLVYHGRLIGVLNAESLHRNGFTDEERLKLEVIARYAATAIAFTASLRVLSIYAEVLHRCETEDEVVKTLLHAVTSQSGLSFNRAAYSDVTDTQRVIIGRFAIGERSAEDAAKVWEELSSRPETIDQIYQLAKRQWPRTYFESLIQNRSVEVAGPLDNQHVEDPIVKAIRTKMAQVVASRDDTTPVGARPCLPGAETDVPYLDVPEYVVVPVYRGNGQETIGLVYADNAFSKARIVDADVAILELLAQQCASVISLLRERATNKVRESELQAAKDANFSHFLKAPIHSVVIACEKALQDLETEQGKSSLKSVVESIRELVLEFNTFIVDTARFDPERDQLRPEPWDIVELVRHVARYYEPLAALKSVTIVVRQDGTSTTATVDPRAVTGPVGSAIENGIQYRSKPGRVEVTVAAKQGDERSIAVSVADDGIGMKDYPDVGTWPAKWRAEKAVEFRPDGKGVGLGNAIRIVRSVGGSVDIQSELGRGTTVTMSFPADPEE